MAMARYYSGRQIRFVPINDLPPIALGLIWVASRENARIGALEDVGSELGASKHEAAGRSGDLTGLEGRAKPRFVLRIRSSELADRGPEDRHVRRSRVSIVGSAGKRAVAAILGGDPLETYS